MVMTLRIDISMLTAVKLNHQPDFHTDEVSEVRSDGALPAELQVRELVAAKP